MCLVSQLKEMLNFIESELSDMKITTDQAKYKAVATLLTVTIDHAQGIYILLSREAYPSAAALMRVLFETYIRAMWIWECANDKQVNTFINKDRVESTNGKPIHFKTLVKAVEASHKFPAYLSEIQANVWNGLNSLTHGGNIQLARNFDGETIQHCFDDDHINEAVQFSAMLSSFAFAGLLDLSSNKDGELVSGRLLQLIEPWAFNTYEPSQVNKPK
jgi:hypothetical protein